MCSCTAVVAGTPLWPPGQASPLRHPWGLGEPHRKGTRRPPFWPGCCRQSRQISQPPGRRLLLGAPGRGAGPAGQRSPCRTIPGCGSAVTAPVPPPCYEPQCGLRGLPPRHALCQGEAQGSRDGDGQDKIKVHLFSFPNSGGSQCTKGSGPGGFSLQGGRSPAAGSQAPTLKAGEEGGHATGVPQLAARASRLPQGAPPATL